MPSENKDKGISPITIISVVTMVETDTDMVVTISSSSLPCLVFNMVWALTAQGSLRLAIFPVMNA